MRIHLVNNRGMGATNLSPSQIYQTALGAGFPSSVAVQMTAIALRETGGTGNPNSYYGGTAKNPESSYGLWQINYNDPGVQKVAQSVGVTDPSQLYDPATNAAVAYALYGGNPNNLNVAWYINKGGVYTAGYQQYLPVAEQVAGVSLPDSATDVDTAAATTVDDSGNVVTTDDSTSADNSGMIYAAAGVAALLGLLVISQR